MSNQDQCQDLLGHFYHVLYGFFFYKWWGINWSLQAFECIDQLANLHSATPCPRYLVTLSWHGIEVQPRNTDVDTPCIDSHDAAYAIKHNFVYIVGLFN